MALNVHAWRFFPAIPLIRWQCQKSECLLLLEIPHQLFTPVKSATAASFGIFLHDASVSYLMYLQGPVLTQRL
jgi:hypothetical protein